MDWTPLKECDYVNLSSPLVGQSDTKPLMQPQQMNTNSSSGLFGQDLKLEHLFCHYTMDTASITLVFPSVRKLAHDFVCYDKRAKETETEKLFWK